MPHLRMPSIDQGVQAFIWAVLFGAFVWAGLLAIGSSGATAVLMACIAFFVIFLFVRLFGGDEPAQPPPSPRGR